VGPLSLFLRIQNVHILFITSILIKGIQQYLPETEHLNAFKIIIMIIKQLLNVASNAMGQHYSVL